MAPICSDSHDKRLVLTGFLALALDRIRHEQPALVQPDI